MCNIYNNQAVVQKGDAKYLFMAIHVETILDYLKPTLKFSSQQELRARIEELQKLNSSNKHEVLLNVDKLNV